jgi:hypothetical protein
LTHAAYSLNLLLAALPRADYELLDKHLTAVELLNEAVLYNAGHKITRAYFPHDGVVSLVVGTMTIRFVEWCSHRLVADRTSEAPTLAHRSLL